MITELCGLKVNDKIRAPMPFSGHATILGFRYYTSRNTGRTAQTISPMTGNSHSILSKRCCVSKSGAALTERNKENV